MSAFIKTIIRNFRQPNSSLRPPSNFMGTFLNNLANEQPKNNNNTSGTYFKEPLAGNMSSFYSTTDEVQTQVQVQATQVAETPKPSQKASIPFMITRSMKMELLGMGYSMDNIKNMTPLEAHSIIQTRK